MATEIILPLSIDTIRKDALKHSLYDLSVGTDIDSTTLCRFRSGRTDMQGKNIVKLINYLYYDNKTKSGL